MAKAVDVRVGEAMAVFVHVDVAAVVAVRVDVVTEVAVRVDVAIVVAVFVNVDVLILVPVRVGVGEAAGGCGVVGVLVTWTVPVGSTPHTREPFRYTVTWSHAEKVVLPAL